MASLTINFCLPRDCSAQILNNTLTPLYNNNYNISYSTVVNLAQTHLYLNTLSNSIIVGFKNEEP